jgi:pimeloyl-ACP methyl ester carboxylesterase
METPNAATVAMKRRAALGLEEQPFLFFTPSERSRSAGEAYWKSLKSRVGEIEPPVSQEGIKAQLLALVAWGEGDSAYNHLPEIKQPVLVANGSHDVMVPTINSFTMAQLLPNACRALLRS